MKEKINKILTKKTLEIKGLNTKTKKITQFTFTNTLIENLKEKMIKPKEETKEEEKERKKEERQIKNLKNNKDIIIKPADKNLGTAIIDKNTYISLAEEHLKDLNYYRKLKTNPLETTNKKINALLKDLKDRKRISKKLEQKLKPKKETQTGSFYILPKLHKPKLGIRPIISNINHPTQNISKHLTRIIQPTAETAHTHIKNAHELTQILENITITQNTFILTADIESLYTNIPHKDGVNTVTTEVYKDKNNKKKPKNKQTFQALLHNTLVNNVFQFNNSHYIQTHGTAMGTSMAPAYANTYLKHKEDKWLTHTKLTPNILLFKRYIDDILIIYNNDTNTLPTLIQELKHTYKPLKLNVEIGKTLPFLDLNINLNERTQKIETNIYHKPMSKKEILNAHSQHPPHTKDGILTSEIRRIEKLCSNTRNKNQQYMILLRKMRNQGYSYRKYKEIKRKTLKKIREEEKRSEKKKEKEEKIKNTILLTYTQNTEEVKNSLLTQWKKAEEETKNLDEKIPLMVGYRTEKSLKKILVRAKM